LNGAATHRLVSICVSTVPLIRPRLPAVTLLADSPIVRGFVTHVQEKTMFSIARKNPGARLSCAALIRSLCVILLFAVSGGNVFAQESISSLACTVNPLYDLFVDAAVM